MGRESLSQRFQIPGYGSFYPREESHRGEIMIATRSPQRLGLAQEFSIPYAPSDVWSASSAAEGKHHSVLEMTVSEIPFVVQMVARKLEGGTSVLNKLHQMKFPQNIGITFVDSAWATHNKGGGIHVFSKCYDDPSAINEMIETLRQDTQRGGRLVAEAAIAHQKPHKGPTIYMTRLFVGRLASIDRAVLRQLVQSKYDTSGTITIEGLIDNGLLSNPSGFLWEVERVFGPPLTTREIKKWGRHFPNNTPINVLKALVVGIIPPDIPIEG